MANCMKCGKEIKGAERSSQVFCGNCLEVMGLYPVKPGTAVYLPNRSAARRQPPRKKAPTPEEQVVHMRKTLRRLRFVIALLLLCLAVSIAGLMEMYRQQQTQDNLGKNYSTVTSTDGT